MKEYDQVHPLDAFFGVHSAVRTVFLNKIVNNNSNNTWAILV